MEKQTKKPRVTWKRDDEKILLQCYFSARNDVSLRSDKGIKSKGWVQIIARLTNEGIFADKDQCKSKYSRLMFEYDVFKRVCDLSGAGWCSVTNAPTLDDEGWSTLAAAQPRNTSLYKRIREEGFVHADLCSLIGGDSRATAEEACSIASLLVDDSHELVRGSAEEEDVEGANEEVDVQDAIQPASALHHSPAVLFSPPSASKRTERVKRLRDGRKKTNKGASTEDAKASIAAFMKTAERYFQLKTQLLSQQLNGATESASTEDLAGSGSDSETLHSLT